MAGSQHTALPRWNARLRKAAVTEASENLQGGQILIEVGNGFDAAEIVFQIEVFVRGVGIFIGQAEANENAGDFESVVHLGDEGDGATFADEDSLFLEAFLESRLGALKNRRVIGR